LPAATPKTYIKKGKTKTKRGGGGGGGGKKNKKNV